MSMSIHALTVPVFTRMLTNLLAIMDTAEAYAAERKFDTSVLAGARLAPDMIPFRGQVMIATDHVKGCVSRLSGRENQVWPDTEQTFDELRLRIQKALELLSSTSETDLEEGATRDVVLKLGGREVPMSGSQYLAHLALPNFYFHITTAYAILRHNGVPIGKADYIG